MSVATRFNALLSNITLTEAQKEAGADRRKAVVKALNSHYWGSTSNTENSKFVGSWGKYTRVRPPRDVDVIFTLPRSVYDRFQNRTGNKQSQLLQEVKGVLAASFSTTAIKGDGPVVKVPFAAYDVELAPAFKLTGGQYWVCMTNDGGSYETADYDAEAKLIRESNESSAGNARHLIKMMKRWQAHCNVPLKSFWIELVAVEFIGQWEHRGKSSMYYDWMVRDFLDYLVGKEFGTLYAPGTYEALYLGNAWVSKAKTARTNSINACNDEADYPNLAGIEWQKIFGTDIPQST